MAAKKRYGQSGGARKKTLAELSLQSGSDRQLTVKNGAEEITTINPGRPAAVQKNAQNQGAMAASGYRQTLSNSHTEPVIPVPVQSGESRIVLNNGGTTIDNGLKKNRLSVLALALSGFLILFVLLFCVIPLKKVSYLQPIVYQDVETYTDQEAYLDAITYTEKEAYTVQEAYTANEPYVVTEPYVTYMPGPPPSENVTPPPPQPIVHYRQVVTYIPVTKYKPVTQYRDVQKVKYELKYRPVQKQRTVTRVKQETRSKTVPMLYYLMTDLRGVDTVRTMPS